jgi:hypothetical protein
MFLNIITPCSRKENLSAIAESINIPKENYRWIVVFDSEEIPDIELPSNAEYYCHKDINSRCGNAQRNHAIDKVKEGYVYFNDDDTTMHPEFWDNIKDSEEDIISFMQVNKDGTLRLYGDNLQVYHIDSHNFVVANRIIEDTRWVIDYYISDGVFAEDCSKKAKTKKYIPKALSVYNTLR